MLEVLLKIKTDAVAATWYLTTTGRAAKWVLRWGSVHTCDEDEKTTMEEKLVAHDPSIGCVTRESRTPW